MQTMKIKKIKIPLYGGTLILICSKKYKKVNKKFGVKISKSSDGVFWFQETKKGYAEYLVAFIGKPDAETIAHETVHLVNQLYSHLEIQKDRDNDEPEAYLTGVLVGKIMKFCNE